MRKLMVMVMVFFFFASPVLADIVGSKHDLSASGGSTLTNETGGTTQVCVFCHTPHGSSTTVSGPLWNRDQQAATAAYNNPNNTMAAGAPDVFDVNDTDAPLCLGCHDGTVGNVLENQPNDFNTTVVDTGFAASPAALGTDLSNDHPIGMVYNDAAGQELNSPVAGFVGSLPLYTSNIGGAAGADAGDVVWCSSCHDVHGKDNGGTDYPFFLNDSMDNSALCVVCHIK